MSERDDTEPAQHGDTLQTIADTPDALTASWITDALQAAGVIDDASVTEVDMTPVGTGQMCDSVRLELRYSHDVDAPATMIAKLPAGDPTSRATALAMRSYEIEVRFYQQIAPTLPLCTPHLYYGDIDVETASFVLLMEDLAPAEQGDQLVGCTPEQATAALDELVNLHAPRWDDPTLADVSWLHGDPEQRQMFMLGLLPMLWQGFRDRYAERLGPDVHEAGDALFANLDGYLRKDTQPWTIAHGDYRLDNLLFTTVDGATSSVAVVDWQTCTHGPALNDVAYFIGAGLLADDRRRHEHDLVRRYHDALLGRGVGDYDWDRCWRDHRQGTWAGLIMAIAASMLVEQTERGDDMFMTMAHRHARHALDLDAPALLRS
jgi:aminoglycoside/choline kinase family phosphotransferase